jgi:hypothetical protein
MEAGNVLFHIPRSKIDRRHVEVRWGVKPLCGSTLLTSLRIDITLTTPPYLHNHTFN